MAVFVLKAVINVGASAMGSASEGETWATGFAGLELSPLVATVLREGVWLVMLSVVLFIKFVPLKWCCATCSCASAVFSIAGLFLMAGLIMLFSLGGGLGGALSWVVGIANAAVYLWLASVLFRDIHRTQAS